MPSMRSGRRASVASTSRARNCAAPVKRSSPGAPDGPVDGRATKASRLAPDLPADDDAGTTGADEKATTAPLASSGASVVSATRGG
jgi:hypothetical protein